jgi:hypothetical protein
LSNLDITITSATKILFIADGARWIWNRVGSLMQSLGIKQSQYHELVDFYHAVEQKWLTSEKAGIRNNVLENSKKSSEHFHCNMR